MPSRRELKLQDISAILLLCGVMGIHVLVFEAGVGGADGWSYLANVESLVEDGDLDLTNNRLTFPPDFPARPYMYSEETGRWVTHEPLGTTFFQAPFYAVFSLMSRVFTPSFEIQKAPYSTLDSKTMMKIIAIAVASNFWAIFAVVLLFALVRMAGVGVWPAFWTGIFCFFGGPLHWYSTTGLSHAASCFCAALVLYLFFKAERDQGAARTWIIALLGAAIGIASTVRYTNGPILFVFMAFYLVKNFGKWRAFLRDEVALGLGCCSTVWINFAYWKVQFGSFLANPHADAGQFSPTLFPPPLAKILLSPLHGFFVFNPVFLLAVVGLVMLIAARRKRAPLFQAAVVGACCFAVIALIYDSYEEWQGTGSYSTRFLTNGVIFLGPALAGFLDGRRLRRARCLLAGAATAFSYCLFLLTRARMFDLRGDPYSVGRSISDYAYIFRERVPVGRVLSAVAGGSHTLKFLAARPLAFCCAAAATVLFFAVVAVLLKKSKTGEADPAGAEA